MTATFTQPDNTSQEATAYKAALDGAALVHNRLAGPFAPHAQATPDMTVAVDAGAIPALGDMPLEVAAQSTGAISAPSVNPRRDIVYVDQTTGVVGVATGAEAASPSDPTLSAGKVAVARVNLTTGMTEITNADLDDVRALGLLGLGDYLTDDGDGSGLFGVVAVGVDLDATPDSDHTANGTTETLTAGEALVFGDLCYVKSDGKMWKADADSEATMPGLRLALESIAADASGVFLKSGSVRDDSWFWTVGGAVYASTTAGGLSQTAPAAGGQVQVVGVARAATIVEFDPGEGRGVVIGRSAPTLSSGMGPTTVSGLGFRPRLVTFFAVFGGSAYSGASWGACDGTSSESVAHEENGYGVSTSTKCIDLNQTASDRARATCTITDDGFTLTWATAGTPSATAIIVWTAYK